MIKFIVEKIIEFKRRKEFNAENCLRKQWDLEQYLLKKQKEEEKRELNEKIDEIKNRISYVIDQSPDQHNVIFQVHENERELYSKVKTYFSNLGFKVVLITIEDLGSDELMIISWE